MAALPIFRSVTTCVALGTGTGWALKVRLAGNTIALEDAVEVILAAKSECRGVVVSVTGKSVELVTPAKTASPVEVTAIPGLKGKL